MLNLPFRSHLEGFARDLPRPMVLHILMAADHAGFSEDFGLGDIAAADAFEHVVLSISRRSATVRCIPLAPPGERGRAGASEPIGAPGWGTYTGAWQTARALHRIVLRQCLSPHIVQAHGLPFEAATGSILARHFGTPLTIVLGADDYARMVSSRLSALSSRRSLRSADLVLLRPVWNGQGDWRAVADGVKTSFLPRVARNATRDIRPAAPSRGFLTVAPLDSWRRNGLQELLWALAITLKKCPDARLDIVGSGSPRATNTLRALLVQLRLTSHVSLLGPMAEHQVLECLPGCLGFAPVLDGTPAMLPVEALFAGVPLLLPPSSDVHGFLRGISAGPKVAAFQVEDLSEAMTKLCEDAEAYRREIQDQSLDLYSRFGPQGVADAYSDALDSVLAASHLTTS